MRDSRDNLFSNLQILSSREHGIFIAQADNQTRTAATGNQFKSCLITNSGGAGIRINDGSCVNNSLTAMRFTDNAGGPTSEAISGLLVLEDIASK
jgi:hypothetical protein